MDLLEYIHKELDYLENKLSLTEDENEQNFYQIKIDALKKLEDCLITMFPPNLTIDDHKKVLAEIAKGIEEDAIEECKKGNYSYAGEIFLISTIILEVKNRLEGVKDAPTT